VVLPLSGAAHLAGNQARAGIEQAAISGVNFSFEDDECSATKSLSIYRKLSDVDGVRFFLGPCCSSPMKVIAPQFRNNGQISMGVCGLSEAVLDSAHGNLFSPFYTIESEDAFVARSMVAMGIFNVALVFWDNEFSRAHESGFLKAFQGKSTSFPFVDFDVVSIRNIILQLRKKDFDAIYVPLVEPLLLGFMRELRNAGVTKPKVFSVFGAQMPDVIKVNGSAADGLVYSHPKIPIEEEAMIYFPGLGSRIFAETISKCAGRYQCVLHELKAGGKFDERGALRHDIELRTIQNGKFVKMQDSRSP
jgi:ABC-type branched-subunit amino acid transport system substrate-binding protein